MFVLYSSDSPVKSLIYKDFKSNHDNFNKLFGYCTFKEIREALVLISMSASVNVASPRMMGFKVAGHKMPRMLVSLLISALRPTARLGELRGDSSGVKYFPLQKFDPVSDFINGPLSKKLPITMKNVKISTIQLPIDDENDKPPVTFFKSTHKLHRLFCRYSFLQRWPQSLKLNRIALRSIIGT